jgi:hypothetical protein
VADGGALAKAIDYSLRRWPAFARYVTNGFYPIDNNPVENAIRPIAIGKKNWLFAGSEAAGQRAAAIQSLLETARLNGIEPMAWLTDTLEETPLLAQQPHRRVVAAQKTRVIVCAHRGGCAERLPPSLLSKPDPFGRRHGAPVSARAVPEFAP